MVHESAVHGQDIGCERLENRRVKGSKRGVVDAPANAHSPSSNSPLGPNCRVVQLTPHNL